MLRCHHLVPCLDVPMSPTRRPPGPRRGFVPADNPDTRTVGVHCWADTVEALEKYAYENDMFPSGAAHVLLRQALGLPPISTDTN